MRPSSTVTTIEGARDPESWPALIPLEQPELPSLDLAKLPTWLGAFARALAAATETPPELPGAMVLAASATACARRLVVEGGPGYHEPTNLWLVVALPPANRKSAVEAAAREPLVKWEEGKALELEPLIRQATSGRKSAEARVKGLRSRLASASCKAEDVRRLTREVADLERELPEVPVTPRLWTSEATPERLGVLLGEHGECMAVLSSESGIFDILGGRYSRGVPNLDLVLKAHAGDADVVDRLSRETVRLRFPRLTFGLSPQPDVLAGLADQPGFVGRGLLGRVLWLVPRSNVGHRTHDGPPVPATVRAAYMAGLHSMLAWPEAADRGCRVLTLDEEARAEWRAYRDAIEEQLRPGGALEHHGAWGGKAPGAALRLGAVLHGVEHAHGRPWEHPIGLATMTAALDLLAVIQKHSVAALAGMGADPRHERARYLLAWLRRQGRTGHTLRDVHRGVEARIRTAAEVRAVADVLAERGYVRVVEPAPSGTAGRPCSATLLVNPAVLR